MQAPGSYADRPVSVIPETNIQQVIIEQRVVEQSPIQPIVNQPIVEQVEVKQSNSEQSVEEQQESVLEQRETIHFVQDTETSYQTIEKDLFPVQSFDFNTVPLDVASSTLDSEQEVIVSTEKKISALSLSSIRARKEMESSLEKKVVNPDDLPKEPFSAEQFMEEWNKYAEKLARSGSMLMSSLMGMVPPVIKGTAVSLVMPNEGSKLSFDENKFDLVNYLRKKLSNYDLEIEIIVNEEVKIQKRVLDKEDKLVRFLELNPAMQYMKEIFDLEFKY